LLWFQLLGAIEFPNKNPACNFSSFPTEVGATFDQAGNCHHKHAYRGAGRKSNTSDCFKSVIFLNDLMQLVSEEFRQF
jgi:hypothetical protein